MLIDLLKIAGGLLLLFFGGEGLLRGAISLARRFGLSDLLVSAVIIGFGTSMPEMTVSIGATLKGSPDIALGNVVGSNIANILLIIGAAAALAPLMVNRAAIRRDVMMMMTATAMLVACAMMDMLNRATGAMMFIALVSYIARAYMIDRKTSSTEVRHIEEDKSGDTPLPPLAAAAACVAGLGALVFGADMMVEGASAIARSYGISEVVIGLTIVAIGTSLPELATAVIATLKKHGDIILGNILGSNIFNILAILGVTAMIKPIPVAPQIAQFDLWVAVAATVMIGAVLMTRNRIGRTAGVAMLAVYTCYTALLYFL